MDAVTFQNEARDAAQTIHVQAAQRMAEYVAKPNCDPEIAIKVFNATKDVAQAVPKDKDMAFANLPVFHIHMNNGRLSGPGTVTPAVEIIDLNTAFGIETAAPTPAMTALAQLGVNADVLDVLVDIAATTHAPPSDHDEILSAMDAL